MAPNPENDEPRWPEKRVAMRRRMFKGGKIVFDNDTCVIDCTVKDISETGAKLKVDAWFQCPEEVDLHLSDGAIYHCIVTRHTESELGVHFVGVKNEKKEP